MHFVFGLSALAMLITTIWMLAADHNREWKKVQTNTQRIEDWTNAALIAQEKTEDFEKERQRLQKQLEREHLTPPPQEMIDRFLADALYDKYLAAKGGSALPDDALTQDYEQLLTIPLNELAAEENRALLTRVLSELRKQVQDDTGIQEAYAALKDISPPAAGAATNEAAVSKTSTPQPKNGEAAQAEPAPTSRSPQAAAQATGSPDAKSASDLKTVLKVRQTLFARMLKVIAGVKFAEDDASEKRKRQRSYYDAVKSEQDIAVRDGLSKAQIGEFQQRIDAIRNEINSLTLRYEQAAAQRQRLEMVLKTATRGEELAAKNLTEFNARVKKLEEVLHEHTDWKYQMVHAIQEMPILDGFSPRLQIQQIWLPKLTLNNNFKDVARFDRCITCHQQIDKTAPGTATEPAFPPQLAEPLRVELPTPATRPDIARPPAEGEFTAAQFNSATQQLYGLRIAPSGILNPNDATVEVIWPDTPAAKAGLTRGDVVTHIQVGQRNEKILSRKDALRYLVSQVAWGQPIRLTVRRGMPHPYASHPRLDLFMGSLSPHKMQTFGCTICHQGQGSATSFKWASHTPNSLRQEAEWEKEYGYFHNHHWIYPMYPDRFVESSCLKCHHNVVDLKSSPRFPDPPAPKVMAGYELITRVGCFGCHEIAGFDGPRSIGPDLRAEPMYYAAAAALALDVPQSQTKFEKLLVQAEEAKQAESAAVFKQSLADLKKIDELARLVAQHPENAPERLQLLEYLNTDIARSGAPEKLLADPALTPEMFAAAQDLVNRPNDMQRRRSLVEQLAAARKSGMPPLRKDSLDSDLVLTRPPLLSASAQKLADQIKTAEMPGTLRKVGPSLRHVAEKLGPGTLDRWIFNPQSIRPSTKMPRFFGLHAGLTEDARHTAALYEPIEARAMAQYLTDKSVPLENLSAPASVTEEPSAERGKLQFQTRGCLACHQQSETPQADSTFGPDLTGLGKKLVTEKGAQWLVSWLRDPKRYHLRTTMPNLMLDPVPLTGEEGKPLRNAQGRTRMTDPAADIAVYLLGEDWKPQSDMFTTFTGGKDAPSSEEPALKQEELDGKLAEFLKTWLPESSEAERREFVSKGVPAGVAETLPGHAKRLSAAMDEDSKRALARHMALDSLVAEYLLTVFPVARTREYLEKGIPAHVLPTLKGAEVELAAPIDDTKKLNYVGRRAIGKFGCTGCHDIPGFESARPIGTGLADWGRKETSKLAFEHILEFLPKEQAQRVQAEKERAEKERFKANPQGGEDPGLRLAGGSAPVPATQKGDHHAAEAHAHLNPEVWGANGFFIEALMHGQREGFLWQKLRQPRSFDYEKTKNKSYNEWLRMPKFNLTDEEREQIMTFVLGLVSEPPDQYVFQPDARQSAIIRGEKALATFNCQGCHVLQTDQWNIAYVPGAIEPVSDATLPPFLREHATPQRRQASLDLDRRGLRTGSIHGMMKLTPAGHPEVSRFIKPDPESEGEFMRLADLEGQEFPATAPFGYDVEMWQPPAVLSGAVVYPKDPLPILSSALLSKNPLIEKHYPVRGGDFARLLLPIAIETQKQGEGADAWAWVPPPLVGQGKKTQDKWLQEFLLDPYPIRPGVILRMPKFNMSSGDASAFVQYFAARDNAEYPNSYGVKDTAQRLSAAERAYQEHLKKGIKSGTRFGDAEKIVLSKSGCIKCHVVGNFTPDGSERAMGPNLADVYRRLKPDYVRNWIAKPSLILPYTKMPVNFPYDPANPAQDGFWEQIPGTMQNVQVYHGDSLQQIDAVSDLLSNWDRFIEGQTSVRKKVDAAGGAAPPAGRTP